MLVEWEKMARKTMSSGALFFNEEGKFIITKPNYKEGWNVPGGQLELEESPTEAFKREVREELGINKEPGAMLCIDYRKPTSSGHDHINFVFDGGMLTRDEIKNIKLQTEELTEYKFVSLEESLTPLVESWAKRLPKCIEAKNEHKIVYLENGEKIN